MIDKLGFSNLFGLYIPTLDHFDYYLEQLSKYRRFSDIKNFIGLYEDAERSIGDMSLHIEEKISETINFLQNSSTITEINYEKNIIDYPSSRSIKYEDGEKYLSVSLNDSNWQILKKYDPPHLNEIGDNWDDFFSKMGCPEVFSKSRNFRNQIFSRLDNKKIKKIQRQTAQEIVRKYQDDFIVEGIKGDEIILKFEEFSELKKFENIGNEYKIKVFSVKRLEDFRLDLIYDLGGNLICKEIANLDNSKFYLKLKEHITGEKLDIKDFLFKRDGDLCVLFDRRLKIDLV